MTLSFEEFFGYVLSFIHELWSIPIFTFGEDSDPITLGSVVFAGLILPVMFTLLFPSLGRS